MEDLGFLFLESLEGYIPCIVAPEVSEFQDRRPFFSQPISLATISSLFAHAIICTPNHLYLT